MPDGIDTPELRAIMHEVVQEQFERIGIYALDSQGLIVTRRNFVVLNELAERTDDIRDLLDARDAERKALEESARAEDEDRRARKIKRHEVFLAMLASIAQYGIAGLLGYGVGWVITYLKGHH